VGRFRGLDQGRSPRRLARGSARCGWRSAVRGPAGGCGTARGRA